LNGEIQAGAVQDLNGVKKNSPLFSIEQSPVTEIFYLAQACSELFCIMHPKTINKHSSLFPLATTKKRNKTYLLTAQ